MYTDNTAQNTIPQKLLFGNHWDTVQISVLCLSSLIQEQILHICRNGCIYRATSIEQPLITNSLITPHNHLILVFVKPEKSDGVVCKVTAAERANPSPEDCSLLFQSPDER